MPVLSASPDAIERAAALLRAGGVVAFPTETVYGLGADAFNAAAVARIFEIKRRPAFDPLIVHVLDTAMLQRVAAPLSGPAQRLAERFWPGPLTLVLPKRPEVPELVTSGLETVGVRMPAHPVARALLAAVGRPLAAPSANPFSYLSPTRAEHVEAMLGDAVDAILDGGPSERGIESTIVGFEDGRPVLLRPGAIPAAAIEEVAGPLRRRAEGEAHPESPGRLAHHYAPRTPIRIVRGAVPEAERARAGFIGLRDGGQGYARVELLSPTGDLRQAAARLFDALHALDAAGLERIDAALVPAEGLGEAINDRLRRAAASSEEGF